MWVECFGPFGASKSITSGHGFGSFGRPAITGPSVGQNIGSNANFVGLETTGNISVPNNGSGVPWQTKSRARIHDFDALSCIRLPRVPDFHASDFFTTFGSNANTTQYGSNFDNENSYIPMLVGTSSWCHDSGATHHVCREATALHESTPYLGTSPLLMGDGTPTKISCVGNSILPTKSKMIHLSNVLCVPNIRKNLLPVSLFANDNNMFFEFHLSYCVVKDILT
ncbi:hypothetical protein PVK06_047249 [Gossypium arboreum]|uniref:Retrovirus-related Pol polyprotein from transposon TNT 1-94-like beta-barrel domain-containing protein n=1 Tax=Gossypium arboreum TaxID=29729 RepID=A0ABR0MD98_GOSAR|nr:hypothetical protein PVK06_047249 [Gossypium arboreum]